MKFECGDLERALAMADLMPEAREHLKSCAACRREYRMWNDISRSARELHVEWETPAIWPNIRKTIEAEQKPVTPWWKEWKLWALAASLVLVAVLVPVLLRRPQPKPTAPFETQRASSTPANQDFLTEQALQEVEKNEAAYRQSIDKLSRLAEPKLKNGDSPMVVNAREKLLMLDSAIAETRADATSNRFNVRLQAALADLYREKQRTLQELLSLEKKN